MHNLSPHVSSRTVGQDVDVMLNFVRDGAPLASVVWTKDGNLLMATGRYTVLTNGNHHISLQSEAIETYF